MLQKNKILEKYTDYEDRLLVNNILESAELCLKNYSVKATSFLDPKQQNIAGDVLDKYPDIKYMLAGGIENSERKICFIYHEDSMEPDVKDAVSIVKFSWYRESRKLSHRDFLGSLIGNGIKREMIGDIILEEDNACLACKREILSYILLNISKIGSVSVKAELMNDAVTRTENVKLINTTVSSLRLDCIISCGYGISRSKALNEIKANKAKVNWEEVLSASKEMKRGDIISLRGKGRIVLEDISGNTKKDRIKVTIKKFM